MGDMPAELQTRLLQVLADLEFYRVSGHVPHNVDVRIIATTPGFAEEGCRNGSFREGLYHRLSVIRVHVPSLPDRRDDITGFAQNIAAAAAAELEIELKVLSAQAQTHLAQQPWTSTVQQLENMCRWLTVMASDSEAQVIDLPPQVRGSESGPTGDADWESLLSA